MQTAFKFSSWWPCPYVNVEDCYRLRLPGCFKDWSEDVEIWGAKANTAPGSSPGPSRNRRGTSPLGELGLERCDNREVGSDTYCTVAVPFSRIPSPFADLTDRADRHFVNNHAHSEVKVLFHKVRDFIHTSRIKGLNEEAHGTFVALQHGSTARWNFLPVRSSRPHFSLDKEKTIPGVPLDVQMRKNAKTAEKDYFIINKDCDICIINDRHVGRRLTAGPLPDFVVILTDCWVVFWWRTGAAVDYVPRAVSEVSLTQILSTIVPTDVSSQDTRKAEEDGTTKEPSPPPGSAKKGVDNNEKPSSPATGSSDRGKDTNQPAAPLETWGDIFNQSLALHRSKLDGLNHTPYKIQEYDGMDLEDVVLAVGTIWDALRNLGTYAFVGEERLNPAYSKVVEDGLLESSGVVGGKNGRFIMPLGFEPNQRKQDKHFQKNQAEIQKQKLAKAKDEKGGKSVPGPLGHILLAVARRRSPETNQVDIEIRDSLPGYENSNHIQERAQKLAAKWLKMEEMTPNFRYVKVIKQPRRFNTCGLFTILNAWSVMLGIPLLGELERSNHRDKNDTEFLERALEIVNLALAGCMDSRTIQALLNVYGYSAEQDVQDFPEHSVDAVRMDPDRLKRRLRRQHHKDRDFPSPTPSPSSSQGSAHSSSDAELKQALFESVVNQTLVENPGLSREEAEDIVRNDPK